MAPRLTPIEAMRRCVAEGPFELDGEMYILDGPQMCETELMWPVCTIGEGEEYVPDGDMYDPITEESGWLNVYEQPTGA